MSGIRPCSQSNPTPFPTSGPCQKKNAVPGLSLRWKPLILNGASGRTRTYNLLIRSQKLYPIELRTPPPTCRATGIEAPSLGKARKKSAEGVWSLESVVRRQGAGTSEVGGSEDRGQSHRGGHVGTRSPEPAPAAGRWKLGPGRGTHASPPTTSCQHPKPLPSPRYSLRRISRLIRRSRELAAAAVVPLFHRGFSAGLDSGNVVYFEAEALGESSWARTTRAPESWYHRG